MFESLGVTDETITVYRALLQQPDLTPAELSREADLPPEVVEESLRQLRDLKMLVPRWTSGRQHGVEYAVHPNLGFALLSQRRRDQIDHMTEQLRQDELRAQVLTQQYGEFLRERTNQDIEIVEGNERAHQRMGEFRPQKSVWSMKPIKQTTGFGKIEESPDNALLQLGIQLRALFTSNLFTSKQGREYCAWQVGQGMQVRSSPQLPMRLTIFDGESVVMAINPASRARVAAAVGAGGY